MKEQITIFFKKDKKHCLVSDILFFEPTKEDLKEIAKAIVLEKWNVK